MSLRFVEVLHASLYGLRVVRWYSIHPWQIDKPNSSLMIVRVEHVSQHDRVRVGVIGPTSELHDLHSGFAPCRYNELDFGLNWPGRQLAYVLQMIRPYLESVPLLAKIAGAIVDAGYASAVAAVVINDRLYHMRLDADLPHTRNCNPAKIVQTPAAYARDSVEPPLGGTEA
jgi:hypothetical protein